VPFVGLTGGLGAGKSTALRALERLGAATLSADDVVHALYDTELVRTAVRLHFGRDVFDGERVDRAALARRVFANQSERTWLEGLLWPLVGVEIGKFQAGLAGIEPPPIAGVVETPLLFESGADRRFDATIAVVADDRLRAARTAERRQDDLAAREQRQLSQQEKADRATYVAVNDGTVAELERRLAEIVAGIAA
jgi:dephospho-CoA kinase